MANVRHGCTAGGTAPREYRSWGHMKARCYNPNDPKYSLYGARGIVVCERWRNDFAEFLSDMGPRPVGTTLDRYPDNDGNYEPGNCRWATATEQNQNSRRTVLITHQGETLCMSEWARRCGLNSGTLWRRINTHGWSVERALTEPAQAR